MVQLTRWSAALSRAGVQVMRVMQSRLICLLALLAFAASMENFGPGNTTWSQEFTDEYQFRDDEFDPREEGIKADHRINVTSDKIALLSAIALTQFSAFESAPKILTLGIFSMTETAASVDVLQEPKRYHVKPVRNLWGPGFTTFRWPTDIINRHEIPVGELYARAVFVERGTPSIFPVCLYSGESAGNVQAYTFVVAPLREMEIQWWIIDARTDDIAVSSQPQTIGANKHYYIQWDGNDNDGLPVGEGYYLLKLKGTYKPLFGRTRTVPLNYGFYHKFDISG
ncbi:MAG: hypothetical protein JSW58_12110 [Candidatus Latescibacterota bacterium]|nr:MAG: hypothetical protein JSW58_12110 [Candidatus Latescibacterota bacterium]